MTDPEVIWTHAAQNDLEEIAWYVGVTAGNFQAAERLLQGFEAKALQYARQPGMGTLHPELSEPFRIFRHKRYLAVYQSAPNGIEIIRVIDGSRDFPTAFGGTLP